MLTEIDKSVPVVMLRSGHHGGLGIARSLGRLGVPVYSVDQTRWEAAFTSRYCRGRFLLDVENETPSAAVEKLRSIARKVGSRPILMPTTDQACIWVAQNDRALRDAFRFPEQDAELSETLCDKDRMQELAQEHGVATARSITPRSREDIAGFIAGATFPVMVKETGGGRLRARAGGSKFLVQTPRELFELCDRVGDLENPNLMIQEFIPGEDWMFDGYFDSRSECLFGITGKKIRRFPVKTGVTSLGICLPNETVFQTTARFMRAIGYRGILDIGYRRDSRDGSYKVLDANPRIGCTFRLFAADGLDVARALHLDLTGRPVPATGNAEGRKWLVEDFDLISALHLWREGSLSFREWVRSLAGVEEAACFALDDPLPFLMMGLTDCCELLHWRRGQAQIRRSSRSVAPALPLASERRY
jgi:predicted ATP-grasp superfamily ATP-dependent carboligase